MNLTFRARLTIGYVLTLSLLLILTAVGFLYALDRIAEKKFDTALWMLGAAEAESAAANVHQRGIARPDDLTVSNTHYREMLGFEQGPLEKYVTVIDDLHRVADMTKNLQTPLPVNAALLARSFAGEAVYQTVKVNGVGSLRVVYMPVRGQAVQHPFVVMVGLPEVFVGGELRSFNTMVALALITLMLLTGASAMMLAERAIEPIDKIAAAVESITALNLQARLPELRTRDQIGRLVTVFNQMLSRLEATFEAQRNFTARAAHELRTPLTILKGETQVTLNRRRTITEYENLLSSNLEEIEKLVVMIDDLLLLARYEGGETDIPRERVRLDELIAGATEELRHIASKKGIDLHILTDELSVEGDPKALKRLVCNLLENALLYTPHVGGRVSVRVALEGRSVHLIVEDNGIGIAPEELPHIFERFYRSPAARELRPEGSGIGLAMSSIITTLHGVTINVASKPGDGTRFTIIFPQHA